MDIGVAQGAIHDLERQLAVRAELGQREEDAALQGLLPVEAEFVAPQHGPHGGLELAIAGHGRHEAGRQRDGQEFFSGEDWRDLFHRALPKLQHVANNMLKRDEWNALDLERLIRVIPHMSDKNSHISVRWMHELIPDVVKIDFSSTPINIGESLYRVASRLGVVDPHFDYYQGRDSIGDLKIQSFAKSTFPQYPLRIEDPITWVGKKEEGGHCFPTQPRCEGCLFETFCPKLYVHFNPSGKGMRGR